MIKNPAATIPPADLPLGRAFNIKQLPGRVAKWLDTPPGRTGVVIRSGSAARTLPPGRQMALSASERLSGGGAGFAAGYVPAEAFPAWVKVDNLLSGDGELVDASVLCQVKVAASERFFNEVVLPRGLVPAGGLDLTGQDAYTALEACAQQYAAADLAAGLPGERLLPALAGALQPVIQQHGLSLVGIDILSFFPAQRRAEVAEKALALYERLQDAELRKKMAVAENEARLEEFIAQLDPRFQQQAALRAGAGGAGAGKTRWVRFYDWLKLQIQQGSLPWRIISLARGESDSKETAPAALRSSRVRRWWLPRSLWLGFVVVVTVGLTRFIWNTAASLGWQNPWEVLSVVWAFGLGAVLESIKALYEKREEINGYHFSEPGTTFLDDLTRNNRVRVDQLVRTGCKRELALCREMLNDLRGRVFRLGKEDLSMQLRDLEKRFDQAARRVEDPAAGAAPYLSDLKISRRIWEDMLDYDEVLLVRAAALSEDLRKIRQHIALEGSDGGLLARSSDRLDDFMHSFETRARALRSTPKDMEVYQMK